MRKIRVNWFGFVMLVFVIFHFLGYKNILSLTIPFKGWIFLMFVYASAVLGGYVGYTFGIMKKDYPKYFVKSDLNDDELIDLEKFGK